MPSSALILSSGLGTRLDPLTRLVAKPAVPLGDRTLIERTIQWLRTAGIDEIVINLHHRAETIAAVVGDGSHLGVKVRYAWEPRVLGSAGGPRHALPLLTSDSFLIVNGDTLGEVDLEAMYRAHVSGGADVTMAVVPHPAPDRYNGVRVDEDHLVTGFVPKGTPGPSWHFVGVQFARQRVFADLPDEEPAETVAGIYREFVASERGRIRAWPTNADLVDVGTPHDYLAAALRFPHTGGRPIPGMTRTVVWPGCRVDPSAVLDGCIVAGSIAVPAGLRATDSILMPAALFSADEPAVRIVGEIAVVSMTSRRG